MSLNFDLMNLVGQAVEIRRTSDKVIAHLNQAFGDPHSGEPFYHFFQDEYWWMDVRWFDSTPLPAWLEALPETTIRVRPACIFDGEWCQ
jgi:hypothetical protein